ncbi:uncharacterized protein [Lepeophtheirus salmonis]|uniref:uncharacterized protein isoform X2 n=1 Tax=Lepeophtheirus salmonis TaxID=72036 RepID=UPI001AE83F4A|nr:aspartyl/asparaginyl beta-hydroxylase-like isoform X2 [Lepeophtheirus salmonis]
MSGEAVRKRNQRKGASAAAPPKIISSKETDIPYTKGGSSCCIKVLFFVLLSTAAVIASAVFTDYQNGQLREAYIQSIPADYRAAVEEAILGFRKQAQWILEETTKISHEVEKQIRALARDIKYGDSNIEEIIFGKDDGKAKKEPKIKMEEATKLKAQQDKKLKAEKDAKLKAEKEAKVKAEKEAKLKAEKEAKLKAEKEAKLKAEQEAKLKAEKEAKLKAEKEAKLKAEKEAKLKAEQEAKLKAEKEAKLKAEQEAKLKVEKEAKLKAEQEAKLKADKEAKLKAEKEGKLKAEQESKLKAEQEAKLKAEKEAKLKAEQESKLKAEQEAKLKAEKEAKLKAEQESKLKAEQEAKLKAEQEAKIKAEQETKLKAEKEAKLKAEQEAKIKAEQETKLKAEKEAKLKAEQEAKLKAEQEAKIKAEKEAKLKAEQKADLKAQREAKIKSEMEAKIKAEQEAKLKAERVAQLKSEEESNSLKKNMRKQKVSEDPSEIRSKIQDKESPSQDDLELKRKLENERLMKENLGNEKNTKSEKDRNEALEAAKKAAKLNQGKSSSLDKRLITNSEDALIMDLLDSADEILEYDPQSALKKFEEILTTSPRAFYGKAMALKKMAELQRSNSKLEMAIDTFQTLLAMGDLVPDALYRMAGEEVVRLLKFRGWNNKAIKTMKLLRIRFPADISFSKEIGVLHLIMGQNEDARIVFEDIRKKHPKDGFTLAHLGFVRKVLAKSDHDLEAAVSFLKRGIATRAEGTLEGNFFFQLGDALSRLNRKKDADAVYQEGADLGIFKSFWQRSLYNVDNLKSQPVWTLSETKIKDDLEKIRVEWEKVRDEVLKVKNGSGFLQESENLLDSGSWQQFEIYKQGRKVKKNCLLTPFTCSLFEHFPPARTNTRGQIKFSIMSDNTHVHAHCGPTNTRLRIHLPLVVPSTADSSNLKLRVTDKYLTWKEGEFLIFDDSFDHEVWNNSGGERLVLIFDIWHPEITSEQAATLPPM